MNKKSLSTLMLACVTLCFVAFVSQVMVACGPGKTKENPTQEANKQDGGQKPDAGTPEKKKEDKPEPPTPDDPPADDDPADQEPTDGGTPDGGDGDFIDLTVTSLAATAEDKAFGKSEKFFTNHPITIRLSAQTDEVVTEPVSLGIYLVQKRENEDTALDALTTCFLGTMTFALFPEPKKDLIQVKTFSIPEKCLVTPDGSKLDKATFNIAIDPAIGVRKEVSRDDKQAGLIVFGKGWAEQGVAECSNVDPDKATFGCVEEFTVERPKESNKFDFVVDNFSLNSPVMVLVDRTRHPDATSEELYNADLSINLEYQARGGEEGTTHKPVTLHYEVCAPNEYDCTDAKNWWPLSIYQRTTTSQNASTSDLKLENSLPNANEIRTHELFAVGETLAKIKATKDFRYIIRATINRGDAKTPVVGELPTHALGEDNDNNFLEKEILIVIPSNAPKESPLNKGFYSFDRKFKKVAGSEVILGLEREYKTEHKLSTAGVTSNLLLQNKIVGWFPWTIYKIEYDFKYLPVFPIGGFSAEVTFFGTKLWEKSLPSGEFKFEKKDIRYSKTQEAKKRYWVKVLPLDIIFSVTGEVGVDFKLELATDVVKDKGDNYPKGKIALTGTATPFANLEVGFKGFANLFRVRGGIAAKVQLVEVRLPLTLTLDTTKDVTGKIQASGEIKLDLEIDYLKGEIGIQTERCKGWWSCSWKKWGYFPLYKYPGWEWKANLLTRKKTVTLAEGMPIP